jgi:hypothetical protein
MIKRRTLLSALPLGILSPFLAACAQAQPAGSLPAQAQASIPMSAQVLAFLGGAPGGVVWLKFTGSVRLIAGNDNPREATLYRAVAATKDTTASHFFDIWQIGTDPISAAASLTSGQADTVLEGNDLGAKGIALTRAFTHPALERPYEFSRLVGTNARVMVIDQTQIWLLDGGISPSPSLNGATQAAFAAWRAV